MSLTKIIDTEDCPICLDKKEVPAVLNCGHVFCSTCINSCIEAKRGCLASCPICRSEINRLVFLPLPGSSNHGKVLYLRNKEKTAGNDDDDEDLRLRELASLPGNDWMYNYFSNYITRPRESIEFRESLTDEQSFPPL